MNTNILATDEKATSSFGLYRLLESQKAAFRQNQNRSLEERSRDLRRLKNALLEHRNKLYAAIDKDFGGHSRDEFMLTEILPCINQINFVLKRLKRWTQASRRSAGIHLQPASVQVIYQPLGVVGMVVPWNYPVLLSMSPLIGALAAGNNVMIKMSELAPALAEALSSMIRKTYDPTQVTVVIGEADVAKEFTHLPFDHLLFTGSTKIGKEVMRAAADHLTPVTLELGGKSPVIIDTDANLADVANSLLFGKCIKAGQSCTAPDYVLCPRDRVTELVSLFRAGYQKMFPNSTSNEDCTAVANDRQAVRIHAFLEDARRKGATVIPLCEISATSGRNGIMPLCLVLEVNEQMRVMQEEIFGPILPIVPYDGFEQALSYVIDRERPLAAYYYGYSRTRQQQVMWSTHSGGLAINDCMTQVSLDDAPFGGIGPSGMGCYHGFEGFKNFSHAKTVLRKSRINSTRLIYAPYGRWVQRLVLWLGFQ